MKRSKFTDEQILKIVREGEAGRKGADLCRTHGITEQTYYRWKAKFGGMELSEMQRLKTVEDENRPAPGLSAPLPTRAISEPVPSHCANACTATPSPVLKTVAPRIVAY
jgi:putative transposase